MLTLADVTRVIAVMETTGRVESDLAETLRAMAAKDRGAAAARRLRLAEDAAQGAQAAASASDRLQEHARRWAVHADEAALRQALDHAATVLTDLARAENHIADILTTLASCDGSDLAARRQLLAAATSTCAQHARDLAQALRWLAQADAAKNQPKQPSAADTGPAQTRLRSSARARLADIDRRLAELRQARTTVPGDSPEPM